MSGWNIESMLYFEIFKNIKMCYIKSEIHDKCIKAISKIILTKMAKI